MFVLRLFLILGVLSHPFCFHCFEKMQVFGKQYRNASQSEKTNIFSFNEDSPSLERCTKIPLRLESGFSLSPSFETVSRWLVPERFQIPLQSFLYDPGFSRPLYLFLAVLLI